MAIEKMVKIRFLGKRFRRGIPAQRTIVVGGQRLWNYKRFPEQDDDGAYVRPISFYDAHKEVFGDKKNFIVSSVSGKKKQDIPQEEVLLTDDLAAAGVVEVEGSLLCPHCDAEIMDPNAVNKMTVHLATHGA